MINIFPNGSSMPSGKPTIRFYLESVKSSTQPVFFLRRTILTLSFNLLLSLPPDGSLPLRFSTINFYEFLVPCKHATCMYFTSTLLIYLPKLLLICDFLHPPPFHEGYFLTFHFHSNLNCM